MGSMIVLGAGLAGLGCAAHLPGSRVFEAADQPGGHARSHTLAGVAFDQGAHISHTKDPDFLKRICAAAGDVCEIAPSVVGNVWQGRWLTYPVQNNLHELPEDDRVRALTDLVESHLRRDQPDPADYLAWCRAQYGEFLTEMFYRRYTAKYWRVGMEELATDWLGGRLLPSQLPRILAGAIRPEPENQAVFTRFRYPRRGGFFGFFAPLYDCLPVTYGERAAEIDTRRKTVLFRSGRKEQYEQLASSIPLPDLVAIIENVPAEIREAAGRLRHTQLLCVNLVVNRPRLTDCHWFYVYDEDVDAARVSLPGNLAPGSVPAGQTAVQAEVFRRDDEPLDADLVERSVAQMGRLLGFERGEVQAVDHVHVRRAYVISDRHRAAAVQAIAAWLGERDIWTMGLFGRWKYVWSDEAYRQGRETAELILGTRRGSWPRRSKTG